MPLLKGIKGWSVRDMNKHDLGYDLKRRNIRLVCRYEIDGKKIEKEAIYETITKDLETAKEIAIQKAKMQLNFPYIKNIDIEVKKRNKKVLQK